MDQIIPKIIHYCWFGKGKMPDLALKCIESWRKFLPDYEIKEWNEDNFDVNAIEYTREAYICKKYAFVSDYARFWILYHYGGLYFDTDVEVIKPMSSILIKGPFMGFENNDQSTTGVAPGLGIGALPGMKFYEMIIDYYKKEHFIDNDGKQNLTTIVKRTTLVLKENGLILENKFQTVMDINIYPYDYFCPIRITDGKLCLTENTVSIHHYAASWTPLTHKLLRKLVLFIGGAKLKIFLSKIKRSIEF